MELKPSKLDPESYAEYVRLRRTAVFAYIVLGTVALFGISLFLRILEFLFR